MSIEMWILCISTTFHSPRKSADPAPNPAPAAAAMCPKWIFGLCMSADALCCWCCCCCGVAVAVTLLLFGLGAKMLSMVNNEAAALEGVAWWWWAAVTTAPPLLGLQTGLKPSPRNMLPKNWCGVKAIEGLEVVWAAVSTMLHTGKKILFSSQIWGK